MEKLYRAEYFDSIFAGMKNRIFQTETEARSFAGRMAGAGITAFVEVQQSPRIAPDCYMILDVVTESNADYSGCGDCAECRYKDIKNGCDGCSRKWMMNDDYETVSDSYIESHTQDYGNYWN